MPQDTDKEAKILELRGKLRDGRTSKASANLDANDRDDDTASGTAFETTDREIRILTGNRKQATADNREPANNGRSPKTQPVRVGRPNRRSSESNGSVTFDSAESTESARTVGRIVTEDAIPERKLEPNKPDGSFGILEPATEKKRGGWPKGKARKPLDVLSSGEPKKLPTIQRPNMLSEKEAKELAEPFTKALEDDFRYLDEYLTMRRKAVGSDTFDQPVWSDLDTEEIEALTRVMLRWGQRNAVAATAVRGVVESADYITVGAIMLPRVKKTVEIMRQTRIPRTRRGQVRENTN